MGKRKLQYGLMIRDHVGAQLAYLVVTDDRWILDGRTLGPETCAVLDATAFYADEYTAASDMRCFLRYVLLDGHSFDALQFVPLVRWIRENFDYPSGGRA